MSADIFRRFRWLTAISTIALVSQAAGCGVDIDSDSDDVTDIANSSVKNQSIGNCWVYATAGWAESLRLTHTGEELNISESYITYWHWFDQIRGGAGGQSALSNLSKDELTTGAWWGTAVEIMRRFGVMDEGTFIPEEAEAARSNRQSAALKAINTSLKSGALSTAEARRDSKIVRAEMDKAWQLNAEVTKILDEAFGEAVTKTLLQSQTLPAGSGLRYLKDVEVGKFFENGKDVRLTLADAVGTPSSTWDHKKRTGQYAWNEVSPPSSGSARRDYFKKVQKAMHERNPVIMTWFVDFNALGSDGAFRAPPATPGRQGGHMTVLEDYQINDVPGYGTLKAGELVTDPAILEAALSSEANLEFFRIKNSWGTSLAPDNSEQFKGYHDLYLKYLDGPIDKCVEVGDDKCARKTGERGLWGMVLPPAGWVTGGGGGPSSCNADLTVTGPAQDISCGGCIEAVCEADDFCCDTAKGSWDEYCVEGEKKICAAP